MSTIDPAEHARIDASFDALRATTEYILATDPTKKEAAAARINDGLNRLSGTSNVLAHMSGWAEAVRHLNAIPPDGPRLTAYDAITGEQINPDGEFPLGMLLGARLAVALIADDTDNAIALWQTATAQDIEDQVLLAVLHQMAGLIAPHMTAEETRTDG